MKKENTFKKLVIKLDLNNQEFSSIRFFTELMERYIIYKYKKNTFENSIKAYQELTSKFELENIGSISQFESFLYGMARVFEREFTFTQTHDLDLVRTSFNA